MTSERRNYFPDGAVVFSRRQAYLLEHAAKLNDVRVRYRGRDAEFDDGLFDLHLAALAYEEAVARARSVPPEPDPIPARPRETDAPLELFGTRRVANELGFSVRRVQQLASDGELEGHLINGRYVFTPAAIDNYRKRSE